MCRDVYSRQLCENVYIYIRISVRIYVFIYIYIMRIYVSESMYVLFLEPTDGRTSSVLIVFLNE